MAVVPAAAVGKDYSLGQRKIGSMRSVLAGLLVIPLLAGCVSSPDPGAPDAAANAPDDAGPDTLILTEELAFSRDLGIGGTELVGINCLGIFSAGDIQDLAIHATWEPTSAATEELDLRVIRFAPFHQITRVTGAGDLLLDLGDPGDADMYAISLIAPLDLPYPQQAVDLHLDILYDGAQPTVQPMICDQEA